MSVQINIAHFIRFCLIDWDLMRHTFFNLKAFKFQNKACPSSLNTTYLSLYLQTLQPQAKAASDVLLEIVPAVGADPTSHLLLSTFVWWIFDEERSVAFC